MPKRPPSLQSGNSNNDRLEPKLLRAVEADSIPDVKDILEQAQARGQCSESFLSIGLVRACDKSLPDVARFLLSHGASPDYASGNKPASLLRAAEYGSLRIAQVLIEYAADLEARDKKGRTALMTAAYKGHKQVVELLLEEGAHVDSVDLRRRNVLHNIAADKGDERATRPGEAPKRKCGMDIVQYLLQAGVNVEAEDHVGRTPLHWTCVTDHEDLMKLLLRTRFGGASPKATVNATDNRDKTPLHLAASHGRGHLARILIAHEADIHARSDGGWTPLHNACTQASASLVQTLLDAGADVNCELLNGRTPLHVAAESGHREVTECLLRHPRCRRNSKDRFGNTPLLIAAQHGNKEIVEKLAPWNHLNDLSTDEKAASQQFNATIVDFGNFKNENRVTRRSVYEVLYAREARDPTRHAVSTLAKNVKGSEFRWIHLPANNIAWCDALLTKRFIEEGATDVEGYKALEMSFTHQHRGQQQHSQFMRPQCQVIHRALEEVDLIPPIDKAGPPAIMLQDAHLLTAVPEDILESPTAAKLHDAGKANGEIQATAGAEPTSGTKQRPKSSKGTGRQDTTTAESSGTRAAKQTSKSSQPQVQRQETASTIATSETSVTPKQNSRPNKANKPSKSPGKQKQRKESGSSVDKPDRHATQRRYNASRNVFLFMPYLHFETDRRRREMHLALENSHLLTHHEADFVLIRAHLEKSSSFLQIRRTLDQYFYHNIDTKVRDADQVVYRFQKNHGKRPDDEIKVFMVDQLFMWVLGKDLVVTAFPQRWRQPRNDALNVLEGIIEDINSKTREPVQNVYQLASTIVGRCLGTFDRHRKGDEEFAFMDMFEASIGDAMDKEASLFGEFSVASQQASEWLRTHQRPNRFSRNLEADSKAHQHAAKKADQFHFDELQDHDPQFLDQLLDVGAETDLLAEIKDIRDELDIIRMVLDHQMNILPDLKDAVKDTYRDDRSLGHRSLEQLRKVDKGFEEQEKTISNPLKDIDRMDKQAERIYTNIRDLLDLKQKHANAFEARFARDQAAGTQRQGQTIMVFTIVTVIFLPLSFIAAFFAINVDQFPHDERTGQQQMSLGYVSQYIFGIGLAISIPCIAIALSVDELGYAMNEAKRRLRKKWLLWKRRTDDPEIEHHLQTIKIEHTLSLAKSMRRSGDVRRSGDLAWHGKSRSRSVVGRRQESPWEGVRWRQPQASWDVERGRRKA
ncbi:ankyrin repeat [Lecanosticta acicola]|uniref:Ankyrin repeat n=1 Tax=Lecanosticta acicola TaxID=111012 RepID=A0AAI8Z936_9PEZI|nr:ankyrin repeat [Lecanosticta acicola]